MRFSVRVNNDRPVGEVIALAQTAEAAHFDQFWVSDDLFMRSALVMLTAVAGATSRIAIGTCIVNPYTLHPAEMAMFAATLDEWSGGRFLLGLSSGAGEFLKWIGVTPENPVAAVKDTLHAVNALLSGERVPITHGFLAGWTEAAYLRFPARRVPIYIGAMSPHMLRAIGEVADGGLPLLFPPEHYETVMPYIREGAARAGRDLEAIDVAACIWCSISDDHEAAAEVLRGKIAYYGHALSPLIWERLGVTRADFDPIEHAMMVEQDEAKARSLVTDAMLKIGIVGTTDTLIERLDRLVAMGVKHLSFGPPLGPDPLEAIRLIGRDVIPRYQAKG